MLLRTTLFRVPRRLPAAPSRLVCTPRALATGVSKKEDTSKFTDAEFGQKVAADDSAAQLMHDASKGKYAYINDFAASLNKGPVKLSFKDAPKTAQDEAQEKALSMIQRSMLVGSLACVMSFVIGWQIVKRWMGVANARVCPAGPTNPERRPPHSTVCAARAWMCSHSRTAAQEFSERMNEKMPKVAADVDSSMLGRRMHDSWLKVPSRPCVEDHAPSCPPAVAAATTAVVAP
jgi:hypothetical protein